MQFEFTATTDAKCCNQRQRMLFLLPALAAFGPTCTHFYLSALPSLASAFDTDVPGAQLTLSAFVWGFAIGMLVHGPASDRLGRRPVLLGGLLLCLAASLGCLTVPTIDALAVARFVQGLGASATLVLARAIVRDVLADEDRRRMLAYMSGAMGVAGAMAPLAGGFVEAAFGWRAHFVTLTLLSAITLLVVARIYPETNPRAPREAVFSSSFSGTASVFRNQIFLRSTAMVCLSYGCFFSFAAGTPFVTIDSLGLTPQAFGVSFFIVSGGLVCGALLSVHLGRIVAATTLIGIGAALSVCAAGAGLALALAETGNVIALIGPMAGVCVACGLVIPNSIARASAPFPQLAGTAASFLGFLQMSSGAVIGFAVGRLYDGTPVPMMAVTFALSLGVLLVFLADARPWSTAPVRQSPEAPPVPRG